MTIPRHTLKIVMSYLKEVFVISKGAWGGGGVVVGFTILKELLGFSVTKTQYAVVLLSAVLVAQFWHGLIQFLKMRPRFVVGSPKQHFRGTSERGSSGTGYYFEVFNPSPSETLEYVRAELISIDPDEVQVLPLVLHIRHQSYCIYETFVNPQSSCQFDIATGPDHNANSQRVIIIPCVMGGDRGHMEHGAIIKDCRYRLLVRVSARNCAPIDVRLEVWIDNDNFLRCVTLGTSALEEL